MAKIHFGPPLQLAEAGTAVGRGRDCSWPRQGLEWAEAGTAVGQDATAVGQDATAMGQGATAVGRGDTAVGQGDTAVGQGATAVGRGKPASTWQKISNAIGAAVSLRPEKRPPPRRALGREHYKLWARPPVP